MKRFTWAGLVVVALGVGACAPAGRVCGDGFCDSRFETSTSCAFDCGGTACGDRVCEAGENCSTCRTDCGDCSGCGDSFCQASIGETCSSCAVDCGSCAGCGDRICQVGETCTTCPGDCGTCGGAASYEGCGGTTCADPFDACTGITNGGVMRSMCTSSCSTDSDCAADMFGGAGDCVSFSSSASTCFHPCVNSDDCYPGFACYVPTGSNGARGNVCLPDAGPIGPSVGAYDRCGTSADCLGGLQCINYTVGSASEDLCSQSPCSGNASCPFDSRGGRGACLTFPGSPSSCWERCRTAADCIDSRFDCADIGGSATPVLVCTPRL